MSLKHFENKARRSFWAIHLEAWRQSGESRRKYCRLHRLTDSTFVRWLKYFEGEEGALKHAKYQAELRREERRKVREKKRQRRARLRFGVNTDVRNRALQAFWAMHVEAMNWSGMGIREYAAVMDLSPYSLRRWRDRLQDNEVEIDWRAHLHPSARPVVGTSAKKLPSESGLTGPLHDPPDVPAPPVRRFFSDEEKRAIALETEQPGVTVSSIARKHGIVTGLLFRWRVQFGISQKRRARLAPVALADGTPATLQLHDLVQPPDEMIAVELADGQRIFVPKDSDPAAVLAYVEQGQTAS